MWKTLRLYFWRGLILAWPLWAVLHAVLVHESDINAWKLGGLAMYTNRLMETEAQIVDLTQEGYPIMNLNPDELALFEEWNESARHYGTLRPPHRLAAEVFRNRPTLHEIQVRFGSQRLAGRTNRLQQYVHFHTYRRETGGSFSWQLDVHHLPVDELVP